MVGQQKEGAIDLPCLSIQLLCLMCAVGSGVVYILTEFCDFEFLGPTVLGTDFNYQYDFPVHPTQKFTKLGNCAKILCITVYTALIKHYHILSVRMKKKAIELRKP